MQDRRRGKILKVIELVKGKVTPTSLLPELTIFHNKQNPYSCELSAVTSNEGKVLRRTNHLLSISL